MCRKLIAAGLLTAQIVLVARCAWSESPNSNEVGNLPAGISHWERGEFHQYPVNPPLVKLLASLPALFMECAKIKVHELNSPGARPEQRIGVSFIRANRDQWFTALAWGRMACLPLVSLGGIVCWHWARDLWGEDAALLALGLWCFNPNIRAWGTTISCDAAATSLGLLASYRFWRWLREPEIGNLLLAGLTLGLAELAKMSLLVFFVLWPVLWIAWRFAKVLDARRMASAGPNDGRYAGPTVESSRRISACRKPPAWQLAAILGLGIYTLNAGYGFEGSFESLGSYTFVSRTLAGDDSATNAGASCNRFTDALLERFPVPVPRNYLLGIDLQKVDFERQRPQYLNGEWKYGGWWYYYLEAILLKEPLGTLLLAGLAWGAIFASRFYVRALPDELVLVAPAAAIFILVSVNCEVAYLRYALPCFPYAFIWISRIGKGISRARWKMGTAVVVAAAWSLVSTLSVYPYNLAYFNELAGGPLGGHRYLVDACIDWGQDLLYLKEWYDAHSEARPLSVALNSLVEPDVLGIEVGPDPPPVFFPPESNDRGDIQRLRPAIDARHSGPVPGWYAMSVHKIQESGGGYRYFLNHFRPVATVGYSIYIYNVTVSDANQVRRRYGLAEYVGAPGGAGLPSE